MVLLKNIFSVINGICLETFWTNTWAVSFSQIGAELSGEGSADFYKTKEELDFLIIISVHFG